MHNSDVVRKLASEASQDGDHWMTLPEDGRRWRQNARWCGIMSPEYVIGLLDRIESLETHLRTTINDVDALTIAIRNNTSCHIGAESSAVIRLSRAIAARYPQPVNPYKPPTTREEAIEFLKRAGIVDESGHMKAEFKS